MTKVALRGLGRIGLHILERLLNEEDFEICVVFEKNPDPQSVTFLINSHFGSVLDQDWDFDQANSEIVRKSSPGNSFRLVTAQNLPESELTGIDFLIDSTGISNDTDELDRLLRKLPKLRVIHTHDHPRDELVTVLGVNQDELSREMRVVSSSICDATAIAPVLKAIDILFGIDSGHITTVHPILNYQNLLDGISESWASPGTTYQYFPLGRSSLNNIIPKPTSAVETTMKSLGPANFHISSFSYRVPTSIVGSADITLLLLRPPDSESEIIERLSQYFNDFEWPVGNLTNSPAVSMDFARSEYSANIDTRWLSLNGGILHLVLWYDNEYGYARNVVDQLKFFAKVVRGEKNV